MLRAYLRSLKKKNHGSSLEVQWLGLCAPTAGGMGSIPGHGTKIPQAAWRGQKKKNKEKTLQTSQSPNTY